MLCLRSRRGKRARSWGVEALYDGNILLGEAEAVSEEFLAERWRWNRAEAHAFTEIYRTPPDLIGLHIEKVMPALLNGWKDMAAAEVPESLVWVRDEEQGGC